MRGWFTWRSVLGSVALSAVTVASLLLFTQQSITLSGLDLFFAVTTAISLGFNLWQLFRDRYKYEPLKNLLIGLLNDLRNRQLRSHQRQFLITSPAGMALGVEAVRLEFYDFVEESKMQFEELREHVVGAIHTLDPDASSQQVFRAAEFGLTPQERQFREEGMNRFIEEARAAEMRRPAAQPAPAQPAQSPPAQQQVQG